MINYEKRIQHEYNTTIRYLYLKNQLKLRNESNQTTNLLDSVLALVLALVWKRRFRQLYCDTFQSMLRQIYNKIIRYKTEIFLINSD